MRNMQWIADGVADMIRLFAHDAYLVHLDQRIDCICRDRPGGDAEASCSYCLGTGKKIIVLPIRLVGEGARTQFRSQQQNVRNENVTLPTFYVEPPAAPATDDLIVDHGELFVVSRADHKRGQDGRHAFTFCEASPVRAHSEVILRNFNRIIGG